MLALVAYDGKQPAELHGAEAELAAEIFGGALAVPEQTRSVVVAVCGARSGKTLVFVACRMLHLALTVSLDRLGPGERGSALIVAPDLRLARQALRYVAGMLEGTPSLAARIIYGDRGGSAVQDGILIAREGDRAVAVECLPASAKGSALRGRSLVGAAMDEAAFFRDSDSVVNDVEVLKALAPRVMSGGQMVIASTVWGEAGVLFEEYAANFGNPKSSLVALAKTETMRPDETTRRIVERERRRDPDNAAREFDCVFMSGSSEAFFPLHAIERSVEAGRLELQRYASADVACGADFAFRQDSSAIVVAQRIGDTIYVNQPVERRPAKGAPLKPSEVTAEFANHARAFGAEQIIVDSHYLESVREGLEPYGIQAVTCPEGQTGKERVYQIVRSAMVEGRVRLPDDARLLIQLKDVVRRPLPGGGLSITSPRTSQGHGDLVSAMVLAVWKLCGAYVTPYESRTIAARFSANAASRDMRALLDSPDHSSDL